MNLPQSPLTWLIGVVTAVAGIAIGLMVKRSKSGDDSGWGFKDVVKDPGYWDDAGSAHKEAEDAVGAAQSWDDATVAAAAKRFLFEIASSRDAWTEMRILQDLGERCHPTVLAILRNKSHYPRLVKPTGKNILPEAPFNRACDLLGDSPPADAVDAVAPFLEDPSKNIRKDAALVIGKTGAGTIVPLVRKAFADPDEYVRSSALNGMKFALNGDRLAPIARVELFPDVKRLLEEDKNADKAAGILFDLNPSHATEVFLSPEVFSADSPVLHEVLEVFADSKTPAPWQRLHTLISTLEKGEMAYPRDYALGEALRLLGQQAMIEDRNFLNARMNHENQQVAEGAAAGLLASHGVEGFEKRIWDTEEKDGYDALTEPQKHYSAVFMCDAEINNGGLAQYFVNSHGRQWRNAIAGFEAMGSVERLQILKAATELFGDAGPTEDRRARQLQLSKLFKKDDTIFDALDSRYFASSETVEVLATRYVLANTDSFR